MLCVKLRFTSPFQLADDITLHDECRIVSLPWLIVGHFDSEAAKNLRYNLVHLHVR